MVAIGCRGFELWLLKVQTTIVSSSFSLTGWQAWLSWPPIYDSWYTFQDMFLEKLSPQQFFILMSSVEKFARSCDQVCGCRLANNSLRGCLQGYSIRFLNKFHDERKRQLKWASVPYVHIYQPSIERRQLLLSTGIRLTVLCSVILYTGIFLHWKIFAKMPGNLTKKILCDWQIVAKILTTVFTKNDPHN